MPNRIKMIQGFALSFAQHTNYVREILLLLVLLVVLGGVTISYCEGIDLSDSMYFAFVTGLTVGYGDIAPKTAAGRVVSVWIAIVGLTFSGVIVAIATRSLREIAEDHRRQESEQ